MFVLSRWLTACLVFTTCSLSQGAEVPTLSGGQITKMLPADKSVISENDHLTCEYETEPLVIKTPPDQPRRLKAWGFVTIRNVKTGELAFTSSVEVSSQAGGPTGIGKRIVASKRLPSGEYLYDAIIVGSVNEGLPSVLSHRTHTLSVR